jgi:dTDP-4-dehydrorhamnose reductase
LICVVGSNGQLALALKKEAPKFNLEIEFIPKEEVDILDFNTVNNFFTKKSPKVVINCSAFTDVDGAETNRIDAQLLNVLAAKNLAKSSKQNHFLLIHISTDYVFNGKRKSIYTDSDEPDPLNWYGYTKMMGEKSINHHAENSIIIRTSWLYSEFKKNFFVSIFQSQLPELRVVNDQFGSPTYAGDLAIAILSICENANKIEYFSQANITVHYSGNTTLSWYEFARLIKKTQKVQLNNYVETSIIPINTNALDQKALRPKFTPLQTSDFFLKLGIKPSNVEEGINSAIEAYEVTR